MRSPQSDGFSFILEFPREPRNERDMFSLRDLGESPQSVVIAICPLPDSWIYLECFVDYLLGSLLTFIILGIIIVSMFRALWGRLLGTAGGQFQTVGWSLFQEHSWKAWILIDLREHSNAHEKKNYSVFHKLLKLISNWLNSIIVVLFAWRCLKLNFITTNISFKTPWWYFCNTPKLFWVY